MDVGVDTLELADFFLSPAGDALETAGPTCQKLAPKERPSFDRSSCRHSASETPLLRCAYRRSDERFHLKAQMGTVLGYPTVASRLCFCL